MIIPLPADPDKRYDPAHCFKSAEGHLKKSEFFKSMACILEVLRISPMHPLALNAMGIICWGLYLSGTSFGQLAIDYMNSCIDRDPENRQALINLVKMYHESWQSPRAKLLCESWLKKHPTDSEIKAFFDLMTRQPNRCRSDRIRMKDAPETDQGVSDPYGVFVGSVRHQLAYLVINKCGCSTFRDWILSVDYQGEGPALNNFHTRHDNDFTFFGPKDRPPEDYFKFTFVRNPFWRVLSFYTDRILNDPTERFLTHEAPQYKDFFYSGMAFEKFVRRLAACPMSLLEQHLAPQTYFLFSGERLVVDFIGRLENIQKDFRLIQKYIDIDVDLPHKRKTTRADHKYLFTEDTASLVYHKYRDDFHMLGYGKDSWKI